MYLSHLKGETFVLVLSVFSSPLCFSKALAVDYYDTLTPHFLPKIQPVPLIVSPSVFPESELSTLSDLQILQHNKLICLHWIPLIKIKVQWLNISASCLEGQTIYLLYSWMEGNNTFRSFYWYNFYLLDSSFNLPTVVLTQFWYFSVLNSPAKLSVFKTLISPPAPSSALVSTENSHISHMALPIYLSLWFSFLTSF